MLTRPKKEVNWTKRMLIFFAVLVLLTILGMVYIWYTMSYRPAASYRDICEENLAWSEDAGAWVDEDGYQYSVVMPKFLNHTWFLSVAMPPEEGAETQSSLDVYPNSGGELLFAANVYEYVDGEVSEYILYVDENGTYLDYSADADANDVFHRHEAEIKEMLQRMQRIWLGES
ncbi:MAG: hypothetical protein LBM28_02605 [Oscillospiraceae bacterium]|jgi:hypothetical protein|nr:hypothetical protein [Oscillospiraceae bacterium]